MSVKLRKKSPFAAANILYSRGTSLIEVLISVLILGIGLLGIASMQAITLRNGQSSMERSQAVMQSYSILDAMRSNVDLARAGRYSMPYTCTPPTANSTLAEKDLADWMSNVQTNLGATSCGTIVCQAIAGPPATNNRLCTVTVEWNDSRGTDGAANQKTITESRI